MKSLDGKVAIVTGSSRGLGRAIAIALGDAGARIVLSGRSETDLNSVAKVLNDNGVEAHVVKCDVTDARQVEGLAASTIERFEHVDVLVNNSGVVDTSSLLDQEPETWDRVIDTNLRGVYLMTRAVGRTLVAQRSGKIINIASNFALMGVSHHAAYSVSKAGVIAFTRSMAIEWARYNVQVNAIAPGYFETDINAAMRADDTLRSTVLSRIPLRRMGDPAEIGPWVVMLAGPSSDFMTGETIVIDGGQSVQ